MGGGEAGARAELGGGAESGEEVAIQGGHQSKGPWVSCGWAILKGVIPILDPFNFVPLGSSEQERGGSWQTPASMGN